MKNLLMTLFLLILTVNANASLNTHLDESDDDTAIAEVTVTKIGSENRFWKQNKPLGPVGDNNPIPSGPNSRPNRGDGSVVEDAGKVIRVARDLVALGEEVYRLIVKGKPNTTVAYTPISVLPNNGNDLAVNILDTEFWSMPKATKYKVSAKNVYGMEVASFTFNVLFSYGGSYNGKGKYITSAQIIPEAVSSKWGYDVSATMKLSGVQNYGSVEDPIAGAILQVNYTIDSMLSSIDNTISIGISGRGEVVKF